MRNPHLPWLVVQPAIFTIAGLLVLGLGACEGEDDEIPCTTNLECIADFGDGYICRDEACIMGCDVAEDCEYIGEGHMCMSGMCMGMETQGPEINQPGPTEADIDLPILTDFNPDPAVFEATLVAAVDDVEIIPGTMTSAFVYKESLDHEGTIPGPFIDVTVGTRVRIHFTNHLPEPTTIHWHGLRLSVNMDGVPEISQPPVQPGETYLYEYTVLDAALFWYHPHFRSDVQVERGLTGLMLVRSENEPQVDVERYFAVDDILLSADGQVTPRDEDPAHYMSEDGRMMMTFTSMMGRHGNRLLLNGKANPIINVQPGSLERWRIANVANARFFNMAIEEHPFRLIGVDGGLIPNPHELEEVIIANAERVDLLIRFDGEPGDEYPLMNRHYNRGHSLADQGDIPLALIRYSDTPIEEPSELPETSREIEFLDVGTTPTHTLILGEKMIFSENRVGFSINDELWPDVTPKTGTVDDVELWEVFNNTDMDHPFHLHGQFFQVQRRKLGDAAEWVDVPYMHWRDTIDILPAETIQFAVRYDGFPGTWIFHCHIFEHGVNGMMGRIDLDDP